MISSYILERACTPNGLTPNTIKRRRVTVGRTKESLRQLHQKKTVDVKTDRDDPLNFSTGERIEFVYEGAPVVKPKSDHRIPPRRSNSTKEQNETINLDTSIKNSTPPVQHMLAFSGLTTEDKAKCMQIAKEGVIISCTMLCTYRAHDHSDPI